MHLFLRAIGFAEFDAEGEKKLIESAAAQSPENNLLMKKNEYYGRAELLVPISDSTGICVYGALEDVRMAVLRHSDLFIIIRCLWGAAEVTMMSYR